MTFRAIDRLGVLGTASGPAGVHFGGGDAVPLGNHVGVPLERPAADEHHGTDYEHDHGGQEPTPTRTEQPGNHGHAGTGHREHGWQRAEVVQPVLAGVCLEGGAVLDHLGGVRVVGQRAEVDRQVAEDFEVIPFLLGVWRGDDEDQRQGYFFNCLSCAWMVFSRCTIASRSPRT